MIKNEPSSRKRVTYDKLKREVLLFEMINENFLLAKLSGTKKNYWSLMNVNGELQEIPEVMNELLES